MLHRNAACLGVACALSLTAIQCGKVGSQTPPGPAAAASSAAKFKTVVCTDKDGIGLEAFRLLAPADWQPEGGIRWVLDNPGMPAVVDFRVRDPKGQDEFQVFPNQAFFWTTNRMLLSTFPPGRKYFGSEVRQPVKPVEALKSIVLQRFRGDVADLKVIGDQPVPELAQLAKAAAQPGLNFFADAAKVRIEYARGGVAMEEEIYAVVEGFSFTLQSMTGPVTNTNWFVDYLFSFKSEKGKLNAQTKTYQTIVHSFKVNPQ
jgi:hypothetical protein